MLTILLLACKSDQGLQDNNQNPGRSLDQEACECPDNSADLTALQEELDNLRNRVVTLESAPAPEPEPEPEAPSSLVVTEYEVMCTAGRESDGTIILQDPYTFAGRGGETVEAGCKVALIDPNDRPFIINIGTLWDYSLAGEASPYHAWETGPRFEPFHFDALDAGMLTRVSADGFVVSSGVISFSMQTHSSSGEEETYIDLPVRVVIFDDKPALRPEAW
jgi:hypothetical protein